MFYFTCSKCSCNYSYCCHSVWSCLLKDPIHVQKSIFKFSKTHVLNTCTIIAAICALFVQIRVDNINSNILHNSIFDLMYLIFGSLLINYLQLFNIPRASNVNFVYNMIQVTFHAIRSLQYEKFPILPQDYFYLNYVLLTTTLMNLC